MEKQNRTYSAHCLVLAFPAQGHINPMLQLSKRLRHKGIKVTFVTTRFMIDTIMSSASSTSDISIRTISDGFDEGGMKQAEGLSAYLDRFREVGSRALTDLIENLNASSDLSPLNCLVCNAFLPWGLEVAKKFGLRSAMFFAQTCAAGSIYYHHYKGILEVPLRETKISLPALPPLEPWDLPTFFYDFGSAPGPLELLKGQFSNIDSAEWILCNSVYELEPEIANWMANMWPWRTIGPAIPSKYLDKQLYDDTNYDFNMFKPNDDACTNWLSNKPKKSVVYVSFGSIASLNTEQMAELSWGLRRSGCYFLWVVRGTEEEKLPKDFIEETKEKGLVVSWCRQMEVLSHEAVGCFVTHCGWNSTMEAMSLGVPMVAMPVRSDQSTNAKFVKDVWRVGVKPKIDKKGVARQESIEECIREIMEGDNGKGIKENATKWKVLIKQAMEEGGSSDRAINDFVASLVTNKN